MTTHGLIDRLTNDRLVEILVDLEDRVPKTVIYECVDRGEPMAQKLIALIADEYAAQNDDLIPSPWLRLHALMILGLSTSDRAGRALVSALRTAAAEQDEFLSGWLAGYWPALLKNKSASCVADLPTSVDNQKNELYLRTAGAEIVLSFAQRQDDGTLDRRLQWIASLAANDDECLEFRLLMAVHLLSFPRHEHRALLEKLAKERCIVGPNYSAQVVRRAFDGMRDTPVWNRFANPWEFYSPEAIDERSKRRTEQPTYELSVDMEKTAERFLRFW